MSVSFCTHGRKDGAQSGGARTELGAPQLTAIIEAQCPGSPRQSLVDTVSALKENGFGPVGDAAVKEVSVRKEDPQCEATDIEDARVQGPGSRRPRGSRTARGTTRRSLAPTKEKRFTGHVKLNHNGGTIASERAEDREREDIVSDRGSFSGCAAKSKQLRCCRLMHELVEIRPRART